MATVELDHLTKTFERGGEAAVRDVSLRIEDGEFMVLLGPSGCGKSTTLRMIAGLESISAGTLSIDGRTMNDVPAKDRDIAMVFQSYALYPHMRVRDNLAFGLRRRGIARDEIDRRVAAVAETLGLSALLARKPYALSGGQRQRVALGRAIVRDPKVFLFDEPLSNLDAALRVSMRGELIKLHHRLGTTMIYVTHDQVEAMTMGTRICIMNRGRVVQIGRPLEVYRRPVDTFVAGFLGNPPMNLLPCRLEAGESAVRVRIGDTVLDLPEAWKSAATLDGRREAILGIRPEDIADQPLSRMTGGGVALATEVVAVEPLGAETILILRLPGLDQDVIARVGRDCPAQRGETIPAWLDPDAVHLFDSSTSLRLERPIQQ